MKMSSSEQQNSSQRRSPCYYFLSTELTYVKKYFKSASIDGIDHVTEGKSVIRRVTWGIILFLSLCCCIYFLVSHATDFASRPTSTTLNIQRPKEGLAFPAVTLCNLSPISRSFSEQQNITEFVRIFSTASQFFVANDDSCDIGGADSSLTFDELFRRGGSPLKDFLMRCTFDVNRTFSVDCRDSFVPIITDLGLCYSFNGFASDNPDTYFQLSGSKFGLRTIVNISQSNYLASLDNNAGIIVSVHNRHAFPDPFQRGISVGPGNHARIGVTSKRLIDSTGKDNCRKNDFEHAVLPDIQYSISACRANARYERIASECNCVAFRTPILEPEIEENCSLADACCIAQASIEADETLDCPPPCDLVTYDTTVSYSKYPFDLLSENIAQFQNIDLDSVEDDLVSVNVFFADLYVEYAETIISYGPQLFVADIGGTLGLFLGASIISFMEIVILFYDEIKGTCCASKKVREGWDKIQLRKIRNNDTLNAEEDDDEVKHEKPEDKKKLNGSEKDSKV